MLNALVGTLLLAGLSCAQTRVQPDQITDPEQLRTSLDLLPATMIQIDQIDMGTQFCYTSFYRLVYYSTDAGIDYRLQRGGPTIRYSECPQGF